ncbi:MAG: hypothetical protein JTT15_03845 [Candidatus Brockarchaeota archaeon]|nr:hypothetical protein [Candidatus Brockarchaeota archaeon]MBO3840331.1 hypothetical protein [Candidatus Brockarchaeota archaeon]
MKKRKKGKYDRLVGGLMGASGALLATPVFNAFLMAFTYHFFPDPHFRSLYIDLGLFLLYTIIGFILVILAAFYHLKALLRNWLRK